MNPPTRVKVGAATYKVSKHRSLGSDDGRFYYGMTHPRTTQIQLNTQQSPSQLRDTTLHECLHAVLNHTTLDIDHDSEEELVSALAPALLSLVRDNPTLVKFLLDKEV